MTGIEILIRDRYSREARLYPALLVALPAALALSAWFQVLQTFGSAVVALLSLCGGIVWLSHLARDRGVALEEHLYASWNGKPSMAMLRHRDTRLPGPLKARYKEFLQEQLSGARFPSEEDEQRDLAAADAIYASASAWLLSLTWDQTRFALLFEEKVNYAFRRNFWALKPIAITIAVCSLLISLGAIVAGGARPGAEPAIEAGLVVLYAFFMVLRVNRDWVQFGAEAYARQLLAACVWLADHANLTQSHSARWRSRTRPSGPK